MTRLAVVADDLTGALDAAAPFAARGLSTVVALGVDGLEAALASGAAVIGVSTDSREIAPELAQQAVAECVSRLPAGLEIFKKVDSRLKGNIAEELDALRFERALVVPAIPAFGRVVRDGRVEGFGVAEPIDIASRLGRHAQAAIIPDATSQIEIEHAVAGLEHDLLIGARALAEAVAADMAPSAVLVPGWSMEAPAICVIGSIDPITLAQIERLRAQSPELSYIAAPDGQLPEQLPASAPLTLLQAVPGVTEKADPVQVAERLGEALLRLQPQAGTTLFISGGATAQTVLRKLGIAVLELLGEALPGLPIARAGGFTIITKSGGFGDAETLVDLFGHFGGLQRERHG
ncbi:Uncharacterized conserved protein YgbK, DUF1537 family [Devosia sp. YR412]|uniref:four-carbon acid sugar kinase family protein n=1 Tax=Devosia sp. YR412 TaxID=1881030 RepID=UPI0008CED1A8|nr:four-carbon acid sugar kinase family protein [Devosia sp. YR412]SEQ48356.1 Uncharacterized conserved protein YgbK, DUF1537 family [Devosia sp. YR412]